MGIDELSRLPGIGPRTAQWRLESLLLGCDWRDLPAGRKADLRRDLADG